MAEDTSPATEAAAFLVRLNSADRKDLERAGLAVRSDYLAWKDAGGRVTQIVTGLGLDEQKARLWQQASAIVRGKAAQVQDEDLQFAVWAAQGVIVGLLAGGSAKRTDLRLLCGPFVQLLRDTPVPASGASAFCEKHPRVLLTYGGCHVCRRMDDKRHRR